MKARFAAFILVLVVSSILTGCKNNRQEDKGGGGAGKVTVITTIFPLYDFARAICGEKGEVKLILPPGVEAHDFEARPADLAAISKGDVFVFTNRAMEPWALKLAKGVVGPEARVVDASAGIKLMKVKRDSADEAVHGEDDHGDVDPHIWLDFGNAIVMVDNILAAVVEKDPANAGYYRDNATSFKKELEKLDADYRYGLAACGKRVVVHAGHYTFGYLAARYGLSYHAAQGLNPDAEPDPAGIVKLLRLVKSSGVGYIYSEELVSPRLAKMIADESGAKVLMLHGAHNISRDELSRNETFIRLMRENLAMLRLGLECR